MDVTKNPALNSLDCYINQLSTLDVSKNTALTMLSCGGNSKLTALDVSKNKALEEFHCYENNLISLDVSKNTELRLLYCEDNKLTVLNLSKNRKITELTCYNNQLTSLDIRNGKNANITKFHATNNPNLACIYVNDKTVDLSAWKKDATAHFVNDEAECTALSVNDIKELAISIYPNPTNGVLNFNFAGERIQHLKVMDLMGKTIIEKKNVNQTETIDLSDFANGLYVVVVQTDKESKAYKIVKK